MKKILFLHTIFEGGGAAIVPRGLFSHLDASGRASVYFAYGRGLRSSNPKVLKFGVSIEQLLHLLLVRFLGLEGYGTYFSTRRLISFIKKEQIDAIHMHNLHGYYVNFFMLFAFLNTTNIKVIWTLHDEWALTSLRAHSMGCVHCTTGEGKCTSLYDYPKSYFPLFGMWMLKKKQQSFSSVKNMTIVCPAKWLAEKVEKSYLRGMAIRVIYNGVDQTLFRPNANKAALREKYGIPADKKVILFSANDLRDENKGIALILAAAERLPQYLFLGLGKGIIDSENIRTTGFVSDRSKVGDIFSLADVYVFASRVETMPLFVAEALASGLPIVAFDIPALREIINPEVGVLVDPYGNVSGMVNEIKNIIEDDNGMRSMSSKARLLAEDKFSLEKFQEAYIEEYLL